MELFQRMQGVAVAMRDRVYSTPACSGGWWWVLTCSPTCGPWLAAVMQGDLVRHDAMQPCNMTSIDVSRVCRRYTLMCAHPPQSCGMTWSVVHKALCACPLSVNHVALDNVRMGAGCAWGWITQQTRERGCGCAGWGPVSRSRDSLFAELINWHVRVHASRVMEHCALQLWLTARGDGLADIISG